MPDNDNVRSVNDAGRILLLNIFYILSCIEDLAILHTII